MAGKKMKISDVWIVKYSDGDYLVDDGTEVFTLAVWSPDQRDSVRFLTREDAQEAASYWPGYARVVRLVKRCKR